MNRTKKLVISLCVILALVMSMILTAFAAGGLSVSVTADKETVAKGETVEITVAVPDYASADKFIGISGSVKYDAEALELASTKVADGIKEENVTLNPTSGEVALLYFNNGAFTDPDPVELTDGGKILVLTFTALKDNPTTSVTFEASEAAKLDGGAVEIIDSADIAGGTAKLGTEAAAEPETEGEGEGEGEGEPGGPSPKTGDPFAKGLLTAVLAMALSSAAMVLLICWKKGISVKKMLKAIRKVFSNRAMKSTLALVLAIGIAAQCGFIFKADAKITERKFYTYADADGSGTVDNTDRDLLRETIVKKNVISEDNLDAADAYTADGKNAITLMDLAIAIQRIEGIIYQTGGDVYSQPSSVYYEVFVRAFCDSNGDGIGDLRGLASKIPYLASLGITGIWMMPINKNNSSHGYDTIDYYAVEDDYGTMEDFEYLAEVAHSYNIDLVMDLVINHCSSSNVWFTEAIKGEYLEDGTRNKYYDYFYFLPPDTQFVDKTDLEIKAEKEAYLAEHGSLDGYVEVYPSRDCATDNGAPARGYSTSAAWRKLNNSRSPLNGWYYTAIFSGMVDVNFNNPDVRKECIDIANFWLDKGMDGFRLDACRHIFGKYFSTIYTEEIASKNKAWWQEFTAAVTAEHPDAYLIGEVWEKNPENMKPFIAEGGLQSLFNFNLASKLLAAAGNESTAYNDADYSESLTDVDSTDLNIVKDLAALYQDYGQVSGGNFVDCTFLSNHDQARVATVLGQNNDHLRTAAAMLLTLPGNPYIYYGEELGVPGPLPDGNVREPFPWYIQPFELKDDGTIATAGSGRNARPIAKGEGMSTWSNPKYSFGGEISVEAQEDVETSLFSFYQELIYARTNIPALKDGGLGEFEVGGQNLLSFVRKTADQRVLVVINLSGETVSEAVAPSAEYGQFIKTVYTSANDTVSSYNGSTVTIAPYSVIVIE